MTKSHQDLLDEITQLRQEMSDIGCAPVGLMPKVLLPKWSWRDVNFATLDLGRIQFGQVTKATASQYWFYTLSFTVAGESPSYSSLTLVHAMHMVQKHAAKVLEDAV